MLRTSVAPAPSQRLAGDLACALDPVVFARKVGIEPDPWQARMLRAPGDRILCCSRQSGKSTVSAIAATHEAIYHPGSLVIMLAPVLGRQAQELLGKVRSIVGDLNDEVDLEVENKATLMFDNGSRVVVVPDKGDNIRGFSGPRLIIIDEAAFVRDETYQAVRPMLAVSEGQLLLLSTPNGKRGFFHYEWTQGGASWHRSLLTAEQCPRISQAWLAEERLKIPAATFDQEYMCSFNESESAVFHHDDIQRALKPNAVSLLFPQGGAT